MLGKILPAVALGGGIALLWPELAWRAGTLQLVTADVSSLQNVSVFKEQDVKYKDILKNCEDVIILEEQGVAILSCDPQRDAWNTVMGTFIDPAPPGAIFQWFYSDPDSFPQPLVLEDFGDRAVVDFHPLGIEYHAESSTLFVVNHASSGPTVELFNYVPWNGFGRAAATHRQTVTHPALWTPNSVHALNGTSFLVTNDHFFRVRERFVAQKIETYGFLPGGNVVHVVLPPAADPVEPTSLGDDADEAAPAPAAPAPIVTTIASSIPFANGIALLNSTTLAVASTGGRSVKLYSLSTNATDGAVSLTYLTDVRAPAMLDNLSVDSSGRLLAAGHPRPGALTETVSRRARCLRLRAAAEEAAAAQAAARAASAEAEAERAAGMQPPPPTEQEELADAASKKRVDVLLSEADKDALLRCAASFDDVSPSWVGELAFDPDTGEGRWKELFVGRGYGASSSAARDVAEGIVLVSGLYETGVLVGRE
ncbi:Glycoside hydrolase family 16 [Neofusicoccum parvum]|nr:Glycoside hydrolase family 16 [Neofusicoccum parvum]